MNVSLYDQVGLKIYREVIGRESSCAANWHKQYGPEALQKKPDMSTMINLGKFSKFASVPMPLDVQLRELRKEKRAQSATMTRFEKATYPKLTDAPVSKMAVDIWGDAAWHSQPKNGEGAPSTYVGWKPPPNRWSKRRWDVDHIQHVREGLAPAHVHARMLLEADGAEPLAVKPAWQS